MQWQPIFAVFFLSVAAIGLSGEAAVGQRTFCNPINLDYGYCPIPDFVKHGKHRTTADPAVVLFRGDYYLFSTNQAGYWWSRDMLNWTFVSREFLTAEQRILESGRKIYDELCAPGLLVMDDALHVVGSTHTRSFTIWKSRKPRVDEWTKAVPDFRAAAWDPAFFLDDDGRVYLYYGSSNKFPIYGTELDALTLQPMGQRRELIQLDDDRHGWERFGEANDNTFLRPFIEGAWMTKYKGKYYLEYSAPGTEFSGYADGVYIGSGPLGPFQYQVHNPISYKPGGYARGAGHGSTFQDPHGNWWHTASIGICVKNNFERRLGIWPAGFDEDDVMYCNTAYGDYPHLLPDAAKAKDPSSRDIRRLDAAQLCQARHRLIHARRLRAEFCGRRRHQDVLERGNRNEPASGSRRTWAQSVRSTRSRSTMRTRTQR